MKFNIDGKLFQQQLQAVNKVINSKNTLSILDNFLLELEGDKLIITGSDQENEVKAQVNVGDTDGAGEIAVPAKTLLDITKEVSNQPLSFKLNDITGEIEIEFQNGQFKFMGVKADEFPKGEKIEDNAVSLELSGDIVLKGLENTIYAVSSETIRPIMTGIYWDIHDEDITFVASDTHKLVRYINSKVKPGLTKDFIMPSKPASIIRGIMKKEDEVFLTIGDKGAHFKFGDFSLTCRFIKGKYPNYNRVIPESNPFVLTIDRVSFLNAMRRVSIFASKASNLVKFDIKNGMIHLAAQDYDYGTSADENVMCDYFGNEMTIGFNSEFTVEILNNIHSETITIKLSDPARPGIFEPLEQAPGENLLTIQMPMQVIE